MGKKASAMIQAEKGYTIEINGQFIGVYQYNTDISSGRKGLEKIKKEGYMVQSVIDNGNLIMFEKPDHPQWDKIKNIFMEL